MDGVISAIFPVLLFSLLLSWLVYVPIFMHLLRQFSEAEFKRCRGRYFFTGASAGFMFYYFFVKAYRGVPDRRIRFHGAIITVTLCYAPLGAVAILCLDSMYKPS
ncbi:hypothetical protein [Steroidobacter cummioxidans]|uniref:hypothetical protein n=1 Tax=Steroidobacter cummioxidans TaxID=1803913 RepID=UPI00128FE09B|nr:hypothetical protein [Steroidobacter cummioxidans]